MKKSSNIERLAVGIALLFATSITLTLNSADS